MDGGIVATALFLGVTHAVEPDHIAGILGLAGDADRGRAALLGAQFGVGHALLVAAWVAAAMFLVGAIPPVADAAGDTVLGMVLLGTAGYVTLGSLRDIAGDDSGVDHRHVGPALARADGGGIPTVGILGAMFTLSPPATMLGFITGVLPTAGPTVAWLAVGAYAAAIVAVMAAVGAAGSTVVRRFGGRHGRYAVVGRLLAALALGWLGVVTLL